MEKLTKLENLTGLQGLSPEAVATPGFEGIHFHADPHYGENYVRGRSNTLSYDDVRARAARRLKPDDFGVYWGGVYLPSVEATNFCIIGIPGSGKTTLIRLLMQSVLPLIGLEDKSKAHAQQTDTRYYAARYGVSNPQDYAAKSETHRALIFDIKPEYLDYLRGMNLNAPIRILDPYHIESCVWDAGKDIDDTRIRTFAKIFIPGSQTGQGNETDAFFVNSARDVIAMVLTALNRSRPGNWTFCDFIDLMQDENQYCAFISQHADLEVSLRQARARLETFQNVVQQIRTFVADVEPASRAWRKAKTRFSLRDWLEQEEIVVLARKEEYRESVDPIYRVMFGVAASLALSYPDTETRRTWFFLDELGNAGELTNLTELMSLGRSKGVAVVIGAQGIPTLQRVFKTKEKVSEILELCAYTAILRVGDGAEEGSASWAERVLGKCEFYESKISVTLSKAYTTGTTDTETKGTTSTTTASEATGKTDTENSSLTEGSSTTDSRQEGTGHTHTKSTNRSLSGPSSGESDAYATNDSLSKGQTQNESNTSGTSRGTTQSQTTGSSTGSNQGSSSAKTQSDTQTHSRTINRDRLEKSLVLASQIASLKTLKYDGVLLGYFISPLATYSMALPGEYITRALQKRAPGDHYGVISAGRPSPATPKASAAEEDALLAERAKTGGATWIRQIDTQ